MKRHCIITAEVDIDDDVFDDEQSLADFMNNHDMTGVIACTPYEANTYKEISTYEEVLSSHTEHLRKVSKHFSDIELSSRNLELALLSNGYDLSQLLSGTNWANEEIRQCFPSITPKRSTNLRV